MPEPARPIALLLLSLYACEAGLLGFLLGKRRLGERGWWPLEGPLALGTAFALVLLVAGVVGVAGSLWRSRRAGTGLGVRLAVLLNVFTVVAALLLGEAALRVLAVPTARGVSILGRELLPYSWATLAEHHRALLRRAGSGGIWAGSYLVHDDDLGWTVGKNRSSPARFCHSSVEGIRSPTPGISYADAVRGKRVIALVGDSYTFGLDVRYEDSWACRLQALLGDGFVVLNFGVDGYGIDQAYLRYLRDVIPWHAEMVLFGMIQHDFSRTLAVYPCLAFPSWEFPFSKPRLELRNGSLGVRNVPLPAPEDLFSRAGIEDLPALDLEGAFDPAQWRSTPLDHSYVARVLLTKFPPPTAAGRASSDAAYRALNAAILRAFKERCSAEGSTPVLVYFPTHGAGDFPDSGERHSDTGKARDVLEAEGLAFLDLTPSLRTLPAGQRFLPHGHYSPAGNAAAAAGVHEAIRPLLR